MADIHCGPQQPGEVEGPFDWAAFTAIAAAASIFIGALSSSAVTGFLNGIIAAFAGSAPATTAGLGGPLLGVLAIIALVSYFLFQPDGCIVPNKGKIACASGIVEQTADLSSTALAVLAPFAVTAAGEFYLVVRTNHQHLIATDAGFVVCNGRSEPMLRCLVRSSFSCGARVGAAVGAIAGGVAGLVLGYLAGAAIASLACGPLAWLCLIIALIVAAIIAAAATYAGAMAGGWVGGAIGAAVGSDPEEAFDALRVGDLVTARGHWNTNPDFGNNEFYYTTQIDLMGHLDASPSYAATDADTHAPDNCGINTDQPIH